jgi:hypothetical protein
MQGWNADVRIEGDVWDRSNEAAHAHAEADRCRLLPPLRRPARRGGAGDARPRDPGRPARHRRHPDRHRRRRADLGRGNGIPGEAAGGQDHRHRARGLAHPQGLPGRRRGRDPARSDHRVPTMACGAPTPASSRSSATPSTTSCWSATRRCRTPHWLWFECGIAADLSGAASLAALRQGVPPSTGRATSARWSAAPARRGRRADARAGPAPGAATRPGRRRAGILSPDCITGRRRRRWSQGRVYLRHECCISATEGCWRAARAIAVVEKADA